jgi:integrase
VQSSDVPVVTPHELRHSTSELWYEEGGTSKEDIRRLLGQKNIGTTERYMHQGDERLIEIARSIAERLFEPSKTPSKLTPHLVLIK